MATQRCILTLVLLLISLPALCIDQGSWAIDINLASTHEKSTYGNGQNYNEENLVMATQIVLILNLDFMTTAITERQLT